MGLNPHLTLMSRPRLPLPRPLARAVCTKRWLPTNSVAPQPPPKKQRLARVHCPIPAQACDVQRRAGVARDKQQKNPSTPRGAVLHCGEASLQRQRRPRQAPVKITLPSLSFVPRILSPEGGAPFPEVLQYRVDAWSGRSKLLFHLPAPKIHLI